MALQAIELKDVHQGSFDRTVSMSEINQVGSLREWP
jgi:hypothetical protein